MESPKETEILVSVVSNQRVSAAATCVAIHHLLQRRERVPIHLHLHSGVYNNSSDMSLLLTFIRLHCCHECHSKLVKNWELDKQN